MIDQLKADLKRDEGWREYAYDDATGEPVTCQGWVTLGYGFMVDKRKGGRIPEPVADYWLEYEIEHRVDDLLDRMPWLKDQPDDVQRALINMSYQLGVDGLMKFKNMLKELRKGDRHEAARAALNSLWAKQTPNRANRIADLIRG